MTAVFNRLVDSELITEHKGAARGTGVEILSGNIVAEPRPEEALVAPPIAGRKPVAVGNQISSPFRIGDLIHHGMNERAIKIFGIDAAAIGGFFIRAQPVDPVATERILRRFRKKFTRGLPLRILRGQFKTGPTA